MAVILSWRYADVLGFDSAFCTHNLHRNALRVSVDFRYQAEGEPLTSHVWSPILAG